MSICQLIVVTVETTGVAGSAAGSTTTDLIHGELVDVYLDYGAAPATTDVTIAYAARGGNILAIANSSTDAFVAPRQKLVDNANAAITNSHAPFLLNDRLVISVAQSDALAPALTVYLRVRIP